MRKVFIVLATVIVLAAGTDAMAAGSEFCTADKLNKNMIGDWKSDDSYVLRIRTGTGGKSCFSLVEGGSNIVRIVRDVVIIKGQLRHLAYYTPVTDGYVTYVDFKLSGNKMTFSWFSSYDLGSGKDTYVRLTNAKPGPVNRSSPRTPKST